MSNRVPFVDLLSAFFVTEIILMHILLISETLTGFAEHFFFVFSFFMPWFYFKSGLFYNRAKSLKETIKGGGKSLLLPFLFFAAIGFLCDLPFAWIGSDDPWYKLLASPFYHILRNGAESGNLPLWFLWSLFFVRIAFHLLMKARIAYLILVFPLIGFLLDRFGIILPLTLSTVFLGTTFYACGYLYTKYGPATWPVTLLAAIVWTGIFFGEMSTVNMWINHVSNGSYLLWVIASIAGLIVVTEAARRMPPLPAIQRIGQNSLTYYALHWIILNTVVHLMRLFGIDTAGWGSAALQAVACIILLPIGDHLLRTKAPGWILGRTQPNTCRR